MSREPNHAELMAAMKETIDAINNETLEFDDYAKIINRYCELSTPQAVIVLCERIERLERALGEIYECSKDPGEVERIAMKALRKDGGE